MYKSPFFIIVLLSFSIATVNASESNIFRPGTTESKILNCVKISVGALALISTYKHNFFFGMATAIAGATCIASGIKGIEKDFEHTDPAVAQKVVVGFEKAKLRIKNAFNALFR